MKKIVAVSGGIDSVVLLHLLKEEKPIVAHFDHGIRDNSAEDAIFVEKLAKQYGLEYVVCKANLGSKCSEATAREARYNFLFELAERYDGIICVAHHADDILESIAINITRGTGWRGLAPMNSRKVERPLLKWRKKDIYQYAAKNDLSFRQDQTNTEGGYLRNRIREVIRFASENNKRKMLELYEKQSEIYSECNTLIDEIISKQGERYSKKIILDSPDECALEILHSILEKEGISLTRPQIKRCIEAIRTFEPKKKISLGSTHFLEVGRYSYRVI